MHIVVFNFTIFFDLILSHFQSTASVSLLMSQMRVGVYPPTNFFGDPIIYELDAAFGCTKSNPTYKHKLLL